MLNLKKFFFSNNDNLINTDFKIIDDYIDNIRSQDVLFYDDIDLIYEKLLDEISVVLNDHFKLNFSLKYWRIIIGPWLRQFIDITYHRFSEIKNFNNYRKSSNVFYNSFVFDNQRVADDMNDWSFISNNDNWNSVFFSQILNVLFPNNIYDEIILDFPKTKTNSILKFYFNKYINFLLLPFSKSFYYKTYFRFFSHFKIGLWTSLLRSKLNYTFLKPSILPNYKLRNSLKNKISSKYVCKENSFEFVLLSLLFSHFPLAYLEWYNIIQKQMLNFYLPVNPKVIFSSNFLNSYDFLKFYTAFYTEGGSQLIVGQHGGHYALANKCVYEDHEIKISNAYLSWGSSLTSLPFNVFNIGFIKFSLRTYIKTKFLSSINTPKKIVFVNAGINTYTYRLDDFVRPDSWFNYLEDTYKVIENVDENIKKNILINNHPTRLNQSNEFFLKHDSTLKFFELKYNSLFNYKYIIVSTYNATVFLEFIYYNIPTVIYLNPIFWKLRPNSSVIFEKLSNVGVFHTNHKSLSDFLNLNSNNISKWWFNENVQNAINDFRKLYLSDINYQIIRKTLFND